MTTPLIVIALLLGPLLVGLFVTRARAIKPVDTQTYMAFGLALSFSFFSLGHFVQTDSMIEMLPPWVPLRRELIYVTGVTELLVAIALLTRKWRTLSAGAAGLMLVLFFPANLYAAVNAVGTGGHTWGPIYLLIRIPLQLLLIASVLLVLGRWPFAPVRGNVESG
jgi:uncharacterized membrane protein